MILSILTDVGLGDLNITYEDGLRLSELYGQMADAEYHLAHMVSSNEAIIVVPVLVVFMAMVFLLAIRPSWRYWLNDFDRGKAKLLPYSRTWLNVPDEYENDPGILAFKELRREYERSVRIWAFVSAGVCVGIFVLIFALCYVYTQTSYEADIASYSAQIDAILAKYGGMA